MNQAVTVPNYLVWAILCTVFFFTPAGVVGVVFSALARRRAARGDMEGGQRASRLALVSCWVSLILGLIIYLLIVVGALPRPSLS